MKPCLLLITAFLTLTLSGCATVFTGTAQPIQIKMVDAQSQEPIPAVRCNIVDCAGTQYHLPSNPGSVILKKGKGPLNLECKKEGYRTYSTPINQSLNAATLLDILFFPTFFVDLTTGAMMEYPEEFVAEMQRR